MADSAIMSKKPVSLSHCWMFFICNETSTRSKQHTRRELEQRERESDFQSLFYLKLKNHQSIRITVVGWHLLFLKKKLRLNTISPTPHWPDPILNIYSKYILFWIWGHQFTYSEYFNKIFKWWPAVLFCKIWTIIQFMCQGYNILWKKKKLTPLTSVTLISSSLRRITSTLVIYPPPVCLIFSFHVAWFDHALLLFFNLKKFNLIF